MKSLRLQLDFATKAWRITSYMFNSICMKEKKEMWHVGKTWNFFGGRSKHLFQLIQFQICFNSAALGSFNPGYLIPSTLDFYVTLLHYLPYCFLRYFHICILLGFFFAHDVNNATKIISSPFLLKLNEMIFTYLSFSIHLLLGFLCYTFPDMLPVLWQSDPVSFGFTFLSLLKAKKEGKDDSSGLGLNATSLGSLSLLL